MKSIKILFVLLFFVSCNQNNNVKEYRQVGQIHYDTVMFIDAQYDYDYWFMDTQKESDTLVFEIEDIYSFTKGDPLEVKWKWERIPFEGDGGTLHWSKKVISVTKLPEEN